MLVRNRSSKRKQKYEACLNLGKNRVINFAELQNQRVSTNITQTAQRNELKIAVKVN